MHDRSDVDIVCNVGLVGFRVVICSDQPNSSGETVFALKPRFQILRCLFERFQRVAFALTLKAFVALSVIEA